MIFLNKNNLRAWFIVIILFLKLHQHLKWTSQPHQEKKNKQANSIGVLPLNLIRKVNPKYKWKHCLTLLLQSRFSSGAHTSYSQQVL